ncbi:UbiH/UbiF/VisC/COQ6 family ubiquinone biosynthesis hydroxylase [Oceanobacter mangrovi]|uniref:UbiH/UbiF/VisC/COQ6 family ubiquinone biosynthesis hydroxylase n=1 Tax=Oceanobacter mangrovi TaxID=2862510 RepID=UPI001C8D05AF|nr:UbiH/UbiF/VisC/COQ6 family ubiquinone biosynthesis hydroxylase [Oceanobacter mangrovi]
MQFDIAIVGAGLVGQALAATLAVADSQLRIALIDPALACSLDLPDGGQTAVADYDLRVSALTARSQALLERAGAWSGIRPQRLQPYQHMTVWDGEGTGQVEFDAADLHAPCLGHIVENRETLAGLAAAVALHRNIQPFALALQSIDHRDANGWLPLQLADGQQLQAQLVVGADGAHSRVRQWVGIPTREWDYQHHAIVATIRTEQPMQQTAWQRFRSEGPLALLPLAGDDHLASIVWSTVPAEAEAMMALPDDQFCQALGDAFERRLGQILEVSERQCIPLRQRHAKHYWNAGVVLAGDAAHTIHPLAGQGVNLGFKDVEVLAEEILKAVARGISPGHDQVLARYQRRRQSDNLTTMAAMESFKRLFASDLPAVRLLRNIGMSQFDRLLPVKQHAMMAAMGL